ncbi:hypothetical protein HUU53_01120 [Candidatus Micrarchaeota archaeon]|nr:hypothetical protein [Candidatus Micrarchaeota archaeon]
MRAQVSIELMAIVTILLLMFVAFTFVYFERQTDLLDSRVSLEGERLCRLVRAEADSAFSAGSGYSGLFVLPDSLLGQSYNATLIPGESRVRFEWFNNHCEAILQSDAFGGILVKGENLVNNVDGFLFFNV